MSIEVKLGDVFYKVEPTDFKYYHRQCRVCEGKKELTVNGITFKCPVCQQETETFRVHGFFVRRYRLYSIEHFISNSDWQYKGEKPNVRYELYHKSGRGYYNSYSNEYKTEKVPSYMFSGECDNFNCPNPTKYSVDNCLYSDYKLAVAVAEKLTQEQVEVVRAYNEANNTDYELPVFDIKHDKKSN